MIVDCIIFLRRILRFYSTASKNIKISEKLTFIRFSFKSISLLSFISFWPFYTDLHQKIAHVATFWDYTEIRILKNKHVCILSTTNLTFIFNIKCLVVIFVAQVFHYNLRKHWFLINIWKTPKLPWHWNANKALITRLDYNMHSPIKTKHYDQHFLLFIQYSTLQFKNAGGNYYKRFWKTELPLTLMYL